MKDRKKKILVAALAVVTAGLITNQVLGADCDAYSTEAIGQQRQQLAMACELTGAMWNVDFNYHRNWCVKGISQADLSKGKSDRAKLIATCEKQADQMDCNAYAQSAVVQHQQNLELSCGLSGAEWNDNPEYHIQWCKKGIPAAKLAEGRRKRAKALYNCLTKR